MIREALVFLLAFLIGIFIQASVFHSLSPAFIAPDLILLLVVVLGLHSKNAFGALGAFLLGIGADFATARYVGPNAAAAVLAFSAVVALSNRLYAERGPAVIFVAALACFVKYCVYAGIFYVYTSWNMFSSQFLRIAIGEAILTGICAPIVFALMRWARGESLLRPLTAGLAGKR